MTLEELLTALWRARLDGASLAVEVKLVTTRANLRKDIIDGGDDAWSGVADVQWNPEAGIVQICEGDPIEYPVSPAIQTHSEGD